MLVKTHKMNFFALEMNHGYKQNFMWAYDRFKIEILFIFRKNFNEQ